jgi:DNA-binding PadR family transcriptional regulator
MSVEMDRSVTSYLPLKPEVLHVLFSLLDGARHGYAIIKDVEERTSGAVRMRPGGLYRHLHRMLRDGLIVESERRPVPDRDDERRRYYDVTPLGKRVAAAEIARMQEMVQEAQSRRLVPRPRGAQ